jgi:hypothetical protein
VGVGRKTGEKSHRWLLQSLDPGLLSFSRADTRIKSPCQAPMAVASVHRI